MFTTGLLPANDNPVADAIFFFASLISMSVEMFGIVFNVINVIVFTKQKSSESMNATLLGLAVSDLGSLFATLFHSVFVSPLFVHNEVPVEPHEVMYPISALPRWCFSRISMWLVLFASFERCLCVAMPLKVKAIVTKTRAQTFVMCTFLFAFALFSPLFVTTRLDWKFSKSRNRTLVGIVQNSEFAHTMDVMSLISGVITFASFALLVILTVVLIVRLNQKSKWRTEHSSSGNDDSMMSRDQRLVKMIVVIDVLLITCYLPSFLLNILIPAIPDLTYTGKLESIYFACWKVAFLLESINSTINIAVYYSMSSKFKAEMHKLFPFLMKNQQGSSK